MRGLVVVAVVASVIVAISACGEDFEDCYGEDLIACSCTNGAEGYAQCQPSQKYGPCVCASGSPGSDAGPDTGSDAGKPCTSDADCPNGCNMRGFCRNP